VHGRGTGITRLPACEIRTRTVLPPDLLPAWYAFRDARATGRAVQWLAGNLLIDGEAAGRFLTGHPDPGLP
jgi:hypothetical protein